MRLYSFVNAYLAPLQHGLQTAHCVSDMSVQYSNGTPAHQAYHDWALHHKTIIICNGGNSEMLTNVFATLKMYAEEFNLPLVKFHEDEQSLNNALTSVAIVVPERFYDVFWTETSEIDLRQAYTNAATNERYVEGTPEYAFIAFLKSFRLA